MTRKQKIKFYSIFVVLLLILPFPWRFALWLPYSILLPLGIVTWNRAQQRIRDEESKSRQEDDAA